MNITFSKLHINEQDNFLARPYSEEHGEGYIIADDPIQVAAGLLIENLGDEDGMIVLVRDDEIAFVLKTLGENKVGFIDYERREPSMAGKIYKENDLHHVGVLKDCGLDKDGKHKLQIVSNDTTDIMNE